MRQRLPSQIVHNLSNDSCWNPFSRKTLCCCNELITQDFLRYGPRNICMQCKMRLPTIHAHLQRLSGTLSRGWIGDLDFAPLVIPSEPPVKRFQSFMKRIKTKHEGALLDINWINKICRVSSEWNRSKSVRFSPTSVTSAHHDPSIAYVSTQMQWMTFGMA